MGVLIFCVAIAAAQTPAFEVATIRPSGPDSPPMAIQRQPGGRMVFSNTPLTMLIAWAYGLDERRIVGAPRGADSARFDVLAQASIPDPPPGQMGLMMRALLTERFGLSAHQEKREIAGYALIVDDGGIKVRVTPSTERPDANPFRMPAAGTLIGTRVNADMLATVLSNQLGQPVENATQLPGVFDFTLQWTPDTGPQADSVSRPSLFTAVREQLGLRLLPRRIAAEVLVIDSLQLTPTGN